MNHKTLISFLLFMIVLVIAYFAIITVNQSSTQESYGVTVLTPSVSYENIKPFRSKNTNRKNQYPQVRNNMQPSLSQSSILSSTTSGNVKNGSIQAVGERNYAYGQSSYNQHATLTASSTARSGGASTLSGGTAGMTSFRATTKNSSSGITSTKDSRPYAAPSEEPFSGSISPGLPDPGGNSDDSCEDDIVFLPVPDGLWYMIFLSFIYALIKIFRGRLKEKKVLKQITSI